jgi:hypothetical protein
MMNLLAAGRCLLGTALAMPLVSLGIVGCDDAPLTSVLFRRENPWTFAQSGVVLPVVVHGEPYPPSSGDTAGIILRSMQQAASWTATPNFIAASSATAEGLRIVYLFNRSAGTDLCRALPPGGAPQDGGRIAVVTAFCSGPERSAVVTGRLGESNGPDDPRFSLLIRQITLDLLRPSPAPRA